MAEAPFTGLTASIKIGTPVPSGTPTLTLLGYASGCDLTLEEDIIEILQFGATFKEKVPSIKDWSLSIDGTVALAKGGSQKTLYDAFTANTKLVFGIYLDETTYFQGEGYVSSFNISAAPDDKISLTAEVAGTGAVTLTVPDGNSGS